MAKDSVIDPLDPWGILNVACAEPKRKCPSIPCGSVLPKIARSKNCPGNLAVTNASRRAWREEQEEAGLGDGDSDDEKAKAPKVYVITLYGAGDTSSEGWAKMEFEAPDYFEFATYEWPGHGLRNQEPLATSMRELGADCFETFREAITKGSFMIVGHGAGCLLATYLGIRAERELQAKPEAVFMIDRSAPSLKTWTETGLKKLAADNHEEAIKAIMDERLSTQDEGLRKLWANEEQLNNDVLPAGAYKFTCPLFAFWAGKLVHESPGPKGKFKKKPQQDPGLVAMMTECFESQTTNPHSKEFVEQWKEWGDKVTIYGIPGSPKDLKMHNRVLGPIYHRVKERLRIAETQSRRDAGMRI